MDINLQVGLKGESKDVVTEKILQLLMVVEELLSMPLRP